MLIEYKNVSIIMSVSATVCNKCGQTLGGFIIGSVSNDILYLGKEAIPK